MQKDALPAFYPPQHFFVLVRGRIRSPPLSDAGRVPVHAMILNPLFATLH